MAKLPSVMTEMSSASEYPDLISTFALSEISAVWMLPLSFGVAVYYEKNYGALAALAVEQALKEQNKTTGTKKIKYKN